MPYGPEISTRLVLGQYYALDGSAATGTITFVPSAQVKDSNGTTILSGLISVMLDDEGSFAVELPCTDDSDLTPSGWYYTVRTRTSGVAPTETKMYLSTSEDSLDLSSGPSPIILAAGNTPPAVEAESYSADVTVREVYGQYLHPNGQPSSGTITFMPSSKVVDPSDSVILSNPIVLSLDVNGSFSIELPTTDNLVLKPLNWHYDVRTRTSGAEPTSFRIYLPYEDGSSVDIADLTPVKPQLLVGNTSVRGPAGPQGETGIQGLQGTQGLQGVQGTQGIQGAQGTTGTQGFYGLQGIQGVQGIQGTQGNVGLQGFYGLQGLQGIQGVWGGGLWTASENPPTGMQVGDRWFSLVSGQEYTWLVDSNGSYQWVDTRTSGFYGPAGAQGIQGVQGFQGTTGTQGFYGVQGPLGAGAQGIQGIQGPQGTTGIQGFYGVQGTDGYQGSDGAQGTQGVQGPQGTIGTQGFTGIQGVKGTDGTSGTSGSQGVQGPQGTIGTQGTTGTQGAQGSQGTTGSQGIQGVQGTQGIQGLQGLTGSQGTQGTQGVQGTHGAQGTQGLQGIQGLQGLQGTTGVQGVTGAQGTTSGITYKALYPNSKTAVGSLGEICIDGANGVLYICTGTNTWQKVSLNSANFTNTGGFN